MEGRCFPWLLCVSSRGSGLNWKQVKQICLIGLVKLPWLPHCCAVEKWGSRRKDLSR